MEREFYYLDEKEQKGPFSIDQLKTVGLKPDTLVWTDGFENWKPVKDVEELKGLLKKTPPPPPIIDNSPNSTIQPSQDNQEDRKVLVEDSNVKFWASFKIYGTAFLLIGLVTLLAYSISNNKKQKLKKEIYAKVDNILGGKTVVLDGIETLTQGELKETGYPKSKNKNSDDLSYLFQDWWEREKLYTIYEATSGGFTIKQLTKQNDDGFDVETIYSGDMGYKKPSRSYVEPQYMDDGWGGRFKISGGYYSNNYRLSVRQCYTEAFEYFTKDDRHSPGAYTPGKYIDISNFSDIRNEYFYMDNTTPRQYSSSGIFSSSWESSGDHGANINTEDWAVYYKTYGKHYEITENETAIRKDLFTYLGITVGTTILLLLILLFAKPKYFRNLNLFGKRWKNTSYQEQIFFFEHSFFGKHTFVEIINDKVSKGIIKFTDKGNTINLSYPNKELFYKIEKINQDDLVLISTKDKSNIAFKRVGAKETEETKKEEATTQTDETIKNEELGNEETNQ
ncbi:MAG: DUF4339 domain-containing protein [Cloacibacterium sp.]